MTQYICDLCLQSFDDMETIRAHLQETHGVEEPGEVGMIDQSIPGQITLQHANGETITIDLDQWIRDHLDELSGPDSGGE